MNRKEILEAAAKTVCVDRQDAYGRPEDSFAKIASFWGTYLETEVSAKDVAIMMCLLKIARIRTGAHKDDNYIDLAGYAACGAEIAGRKSNE